MRTQLCGDVSRPSPSRTRLRVQQIHLDRPRLRTALRLRPHGVMLSDIAVADGAPGAERVHDEHRAESYMTLLTARVFLSIQRPLYN